MFGRGGILWNHVCEVQVVISNVDIGGDDSSILEAKALIYAMRLAIDYEVDYVCFELEEQRVVQAMKNSRIDIS